MYCIPMYLFLLIQVGPLLRTFYIYSSDRNVQHSDEGSDQWNPPYCLHLYGWQSWWYVDVAITDKMGSVSLSASRISIEVVLLLLFYGQYSRLSSNLQLPSAHRVPVRHIYQISLLMLPTSNLQSVFFIRTFKLWKASPHPLFPFAYNFVVKLPLNEVFPQNPVSYLLIILFTIRCTCNKKLNSNYNVFGFKHIIFRYHMRKRPTFWCPPADRIGWNIDTDQFLH